MYRCINWNRAFGGASRAIETTPGVTRSKREVTSCSSLPLACAYAVSCKSRSAERHGVTNCLYTSAEATRASLIPGEMMERQGKQPLAKEREKAATFVKPSTLKDCWPPYPYQNLKKDSSVQTSNVMCTKPHNRRTVLPQGLYRRKTDG